MAGCNSPACAPGYKPGVWSAATTATGSIELFLFNLSLDLSLGDEPSRPLTKEKDKEGGEKDARM